MFQQPERKSSSESSELSNVSSIDGIYLVDNLIGQRSRDVIGPFGQ